MLAKRIACFGSCFKGLVSVLSAGVSVSLCYESIEQEVLGLSRDVASEVLGRVLDATLSNTEVLSAVRVYGGRLGYRFVRYQPLTIRLATGESWAVRSPYFVKSSGKRGRKKRGPNGRGCHLLLELLGLVARCSSVFVSDVVSMCLLCPSLEVCQQVLSHRGVAVDVKTLRRLCGQLGELCLESRADSVLDTEESLAGKRVLIGIDGGRLRLRRPKRGRKKEGQKRQGYHTDWKEPKLFTLHVLDEEGKLQQASTPLIDATMGDADALFALLGEYLMRLDIAQAQCVIFVGDGAEWIWNRVDACIQAWGLTQAYQVLDYFHASQHLWGLLELRTDLSDARRQCLYQQCKSLLWDGDIEGLVDVISQQARGKARKQMLNGLDYFHKHAKRMQYRHFKQQGVPQGSGVVESAIRRVINLRLKAPGTFWTPRMAECFLFLRAQLLAGRWIHVMRHVTQRRRTQWNAGKQANTNGSDKVMRLEPNDTTNHKYMECVA